MKRREGIMTAAEPLGIPGLPLARFLTAAEYAQLGETGWGYTELMEGRILVSPSPTAKHNLAGFALARHLHPQLSDTVRVILDVDIDLGLVPADQPGSVRRPDLVVVDSKAINHRHVHHQRAVPRAATARPADLNWPAPVRFSTSTQHGRISAHWATPTERPG
jgi:hypothetical protein